MTKKIPKLSDEDIEILSEHIAEVIRKAVDITIANHESLKRLDEALNVLFPQWVYCEDGDGWVKPGPSIVQRVTWLEERAGRSGGRWLR